MTDSTEPTAPLGPLLRGSSAVGPIFILGMTQRTGTNFLLNLLCLHRECSPAGPVWEDYFVAHADLLVRFAKEVSESWDPKWGIDPMVGGGIICRLLGDGLVSFLHCERDIAVLGAAFELPSGSGTEGERRRRLVTKTPSVKSLEHFFKILPQAHLLIIVRDGRAVVESQVQSFGGDYEGAIRHWANSARIILQFQKRTVHGNFRYRLVKYEELWTHREPELRRILQFLELDVESYDFEAANNLPIRGSSALTEHGIRMHWAPVEKTDDFNPLRRWATWGRARHERFNWIAGDCLELLGYEKKIYPGWEWLWRIWNSVLDQGCAFQHLRRTITDSLKRLRL